MNPRNCLLESFSVAVKAADPLHIVPQHLPDPPRGRTFVVGAGKASAAMALAIENSWPANAQLNGFVVTRYGHALPTHKIRIIEAGHPIPDENGEQASREILAAVKALGPEDLLLCVFSGGGSSLLSLPIDGVSLRELKEVTRQLLRCGASIQEINTVRKHLSAIQGGRLAAACKAPIMALIISDVTGDAATHIASGPCAPDPTSFSDALTVLDRYHLDVTPAVRQVLLTGVERAVDETPKPGASVFTRVENRIIANAHQSLMAAADYFQSLNIATLILGDTVTGESREIAKGYAALAKEIRLHPQLLRAPIVLLSGGETTVTIRGNGRGGRNSEFLLSLLIELDGLEKIYALACDTDGIDGTENSAGALLTPDSFIRAKALGLNAAAFLTNNDAYTFFRHLNDLVVTGPTYTNVNDYRAILIL
ncbi:hydroxypyruvate reductase [Nitrosomonas sp. Nm84]|uniref:glycerate kinase type-2 family protein n=1 Tax=Nitrosomonas sp. Nm84 TaxID=200124 RepID=UPI000D753D71|nr:glycerate kinase [Nitrosomonas sp. Nm84]PXW90813.1 hydroxypyruvate reductase [Nitrosomonas sp. Nm84]